MAVATLKKGRNIHSLDMSIRQNNGRLLAVSHSMKLLLGEKRGLALQAYKMANAHLDELREGKRLFDPASGISLEKRASGSWKGSQNIVTLKVSAQGKMFFLKVSKYKSYMDVLRGFRVTEAFLRRRGYHFEGSNVRVIKPHIIYEDRHAEKTWIATDFFNEGEVVLVSDMGKSAMGKGMTEMLGKLRDRLEGEQSVCEIIPTNAFYQPKTDTVLLFDIQFFDAKKAMEA